jgi:SAM-dependent methyltransferase
MAVNETERLNVPAIEWNWDSANYFAEWHEPIYELMARYVPEGSTVLEVGAGGSHTLGAIAGRLKCRSYGVEPDEQGIAKTIELADLESGNVKMIRGDGFRLPFDDDSFDVVYSLGLIEHFEKSESSALISEHVRVCKKDGTVIVAVPNLLNFPHTLRKWILGSRYEYYPERSYSPGELKSLILGQGLAIQETDGVSPMWGLAMFSGAWRLIAVLDRLGISKRLREIEKPGTRAALGYMTYAIAKK